MLPDGDAASRVDETTKAESHQAHENEESE